MKLKNKKGAAIVEFAIVLPLLIVLVFGIIEFGFLLYDKAMITNACREGARAGIVLNGDGTRPDNTAIRKVVKDSLLKTVQGSCGGKDTSTSLLITFGSDTVEDGDIVIMPPEPRDSLPFGTDLFVSVTYHYDFLLLPNFIEGLVGNIKAETVMKLD